VATGPVFVAGATGYSGREVVRESVARGVETVAHVRPDSARLAHWREHFEGLGARVDTTAWQLAAMRETLERLQPSVVYSLLGTTRKRGKHGSGSVVADTYEAVDYGLSVLLLEAAVACDSRPRFVYLSAIGADKRTRNAYLDVRKRVEAAVRGSGLPYLIARPAMISGDDREENRPGERTFAKLGDALLGVVGALGGKKIQARYASLGAAELAAGLVELVASASEDAIVVEPDALRAAAAR
jgi:uncharacterized protein YbjT (DUF2867 family)